MCSHLEHIFNLILGSNETPKQDMWLDPYSVYSWFYLYTAEPTGQLAEQETGWRFV